MPFYWVQHAYVTFSDLTAQACTVSSCFYFNTSQSKKICLSGKKNPPYCRENFRDLSISHMAEHTKAWFPLCFLYLAACQRAWKPLSGKVRVSRKDVSETQECRDEARSARRVLLYITRHTFPEHKFNYKWGLGSNDVMFPKKKKEKNKLL